MEVTVSHIKKVTLRSGSPGWVQGLKHLSHHLLPLECSVSKLGQKEVLGLQAAL